MNRHLKLLVCLCGAAAFAADGENAAPADELAARRLEAAIPLAPEGYRRPKDWKPAL